MSDLTDFLAARLDEDERAARRIPKKYPRWRVWLRRLRYGR